MGSISISNSEIESFLRCRRMWHYVSDNQLGLRSLSLSPHTAFHVGAVVHRALEMQVSLGRRPNVSALIDEAERELEDYYRSIVGVGWSNVERLALVESRNLILGMTNHYFDYYGDENPLGDYTYKHAELTFKVPIPGTEHFLKGTIDGIAQDKDGNVYLVEHKTTSTSFPEAIDLQISRQLQAYVWASRVLLNEPVVGIIYDGIAKKVPSVPTVTQSGRLSKAAITTTPEIYRQAIRILELDEADYTDVLEKLEKQSPFFRRHVIRFPPASLDLFSEQLKQIVTDMANPDLPLYPNRIWSGCWDCRYQDLCTAQQLGEDWQTIVELKYKKEISQGPSHRNVPVTSLNLKED